MILSTSLHAVTDFAADAVPFHDALAQIAGAGYRGVMLLDRPGKPALRDGARPPCALIDVAASDPAELRQALAEAGLRPVALHRGCMTVADETQAEQAALALGEAVVVAARLGIGVVIPNGGVAPAGSMSTADKEPYLRRMAAVMDRALEAAPAGLKLAVDLHCGAVVETVADAERLFSLTGDSRAGLTLNIGHLTTGGQPGWELIERAPERLHVIAWKDHLRQPPSDWPHRVWSVELGTGDSPFERYIEALRRTPVTAEHLITFENIPLADKPAALRRSREHLERLWRGG